jgi:hypothetical protein
VNSRRCPVDGRELPAPAAEDGRVRTCEACKGSLFAEERLMRMVRNNGIDFLKAQGRPAREIGCPGCALAMQVFMIEGIEIDICPKCVLVWMDEGEFPKTRAVLEKDAADRERMKSSRGGSIPHGSAEGPFDDWFGGPGADDWFRGSGVDGWNKAEIVWMLLRILFRAFR